MKRPPRWVSLLALLLILGLLAVTHPLQARPLTQSVTMNATVTGPDAEGKYRIQGTISANDFAPDETGHVHYSNSLTVIAEFMGSEGR